VDKKRCTHHGLGPVPFPSCPIPCRALRLPSTRSRGYRMLGSASVQRIKAPFCLQHRASFMCDVGQDLWPAVTCKDCWRRQMIQFSSDGGYYRV
jgi:hypothetical protein